MDPQAEYPAEQPNVVGCLLKLVAYLIVFGVIAIFGLGILAGIVIARGL